MYKIGQIFENKYTLQVVKWCNNNNAVIVEIEKQGTSRLFQIQEKPALTEEELAQIALEEAKAARADYVSKIIVEVDGMMFDGDETSQDRMARSIVALDLDETVQWVLADNSIALVTRAQLREALRKAGTAQTAIWSDPYTK
jgi:hypothetical protein